MITQLITSSFLPFKTMLCCQMQTYTLKKSNRKDKKFQLINEQTGKTTSFGANGMNDYVKSGADTDRRERYINRHQKRESHLWTHSKQHLETPSYLSRYILWEEPTIAKSVKKIEDKLKVKIKIQK